jgi:hypothetical protein
MGGFQTAPLKARKRVSSFDAEELEKNKELVRQYFDLVNEAEIYKKIQGLISLRHHFCSLHRGHCLRMNIGSCCLRFVLFHSLASESISKR